MTDIEAAYVAGLFDGDGSVILHDRGPGHQRLLLRCVIGNTDESLLAWLKATTGTGAVFAKARRSEQYKACYEWQLYGQNAAAFLRQLLPHLIVKRDQAAAGIASQP